MKTIIIDDEPDVLLTYNAYLNELGYPKATTISDSSKFKDPEEIKRLISDYDLVICDIHMPDVRGNEILKQFMSFREKDSKSPAFIVITGVPPSYFPKDPEGWGSLTMADEILGKPVELEEFETALKKLGFYPRSSA